MLNPTIVFIDDECIFCNFWGGYILKNDKSDSILISPSTSNMFKETKKKFKLFPNPKETIILYHNGQIYSKSLAVIKISVLFITLVLFEQSSLSLLKVGVNIGNCFFLNCPKCSFSFFIL